MVILRATSFLERHKSDTKGTCRITQDRLLLKERKSTCMLRITLSCDSINLGRICWEIKLLCSFY
jgi:hypothetical protein